MALRVGELASRDEKKAIRYAAVGMNFDRYVGTGPLLGLYSRYFWDMELNRATQVIAAYDGDHLAGVLLAAMEGEEPVRRYWRRSLFVKFADFVRDRFFGDSEGRYDEANARMLAELRKAHAPDGEICFLAADPESKVRGIGTALVEELARREPGKLVFLYTDSFCSYGFYDHRGFERVGEEPIVLEIGGRKVPLDCFLYSKTL